MPDPERGPVLPGLPCSSLVALWRSEAIYPLSARVLGQTRSGGQYFVVNFLTREPLPCVSPRYM